LDARVGSVLCLVPRGLCLDARVGGVLCLFEEVFAWMLGWVVCFV